MGLRDLLKEKKAEVTARWFDLIVETYPSDTSTFLRSNKDRFANPVGQTFLTETATIYDLLLEGAGKEELLGPLEAIVKIRAVQDFSPSDGVGFVFLLKRAVREVLGGVCDEGGMRSDLSALDAEIDRLALLSFDLYTECIKRIYEIRTSEVKNNTYMLLRRANLII